MAVAPGVAAPHVAAAVPVAPTTVGVTVTPLAAALPAAAVLLTFAVSVTACPATRGDAGWAAKATASAAGVWTVVAGAVVAAPTSAVPVPPAVPFAVAVKVSVPAPETVQLNA